MLQHAHGRKNTQWRMRQASLDTFLPDHAGRARQLERAPDNSSVARLRQMKLDELTQTLANVSLEKTTLAGVVADDLTSMMKDDLRVERVGGRKNETSEEKMKGLMRLTFYSSGLSLEACKSMHTKFVDTIELIDSENICDQVLRSQIPVCKNKRRVATLRELALKGTTWIEELDRMPLKIASKRLQAISGIGRYTAHSYLVVYHGSAHKMNGWIPGDKAVQNTLKRVFNMEGESPDSFAQRYFGGRGTQCFLTLQAFDKLRRRSPPRAVAVHAALAMKLLSIAAVRDGNCDAPPRRLGVKK